VFIIFNTQNCTFLQEMKIKIELSKISKFLNINKPTIIINKELAFSYVNNIIYIDENNDIKSLFLALHELRHHYQYLYIKNNNDELKKIWKNEFDNYDLNNYLNYNIELDAYSFSYLILKYIYKINYNLPYLIKNKILEYIKKNKYLYFNIFNYNL